MDKLQELIKKEYAFIHIQGGSFGAYCFPHVKGYEPSRVVHQVLGSYDKKYFVDFLESKN